MLPHHEPEDQQATVTPGHGNVPAAGDGHGTGWPRSGVASRAGMEWPDGSSNETRWFPSGRVDLIDRGREGRFEHRVRITIDPGGAVAVERLATGGQFEAVASERASTTVNPFGGTVERIEHPGVVSIRRAFDDDGNLRSVVLEGDWGREELELRPDGARSMAWSNPLHHGRADWDAGGHVVRYEATFAAGGAYRWEQLRGTGRETVTSRSGAVSIEDGVPPPALEDRAL